MVEIDDRERDIKSLLQQGFTYPPTGAEGSKVYNPVFDKGKDVEPIIPDTRAEMSGVSGDVLRVVKV